MVVCVFEWRYGSPEMRRLLSRESIVEAYKRVEIALLEALEEAGLAPRGVAGEARRAAEAVSAEDVYGGEAGVGHEVAALVFLMGRAGGGRVTRWLHYGATSNDIIDTAWALLLRDALGILKRRLRMVIERLAALAEETARLVMPGRTHGQYAVPVTLGFKLANYVYELARSYERLCGVEERVVRLKLGGAVGTMAAWRGAGLRVREAVARRLGLKPHAISTQIAPRDGYAELAAVLAILASSLDRLAVEVRELSRPEIGELWEDPGGRVGSSTMPHKANPVTAERISGLARAVRSIAHGFMENIVLWHERDLSNSSFERLMLPHLLLAVDQILLDTLELLNRLRYSPERMAENTRRAWMQAVSEPLLHALIDEGYGREEAYRLAKRVATLVSTGHSLEEALGEAGIRLSKPLPRPEEYLGEAARLVEDAIRYARDAIAGCDGKTR